MSNRITLDEAAETFRRHPSVSTARLVRMLARQYRADDVIDHKAFLGFFRETEGYGTAMKRVELDMRAVDKLDEIADIHGVSRQEYLHALIHYAISTINRPGSWEACRPFDFANYDERSREAAADRWF